MYGMPQPNQYGQYGFGAYGAFPSQGAAAPGAGGAGSPGMPQPGGAAGTGLGISAGTQQPDPNAAAGQVGQAQWGGADPSYYSNYWGGQSFQFLPLSWISVSTHWHQVIMDRQLVSKAVGMFRCKALLHDST